MCDFVDDVDIFTFKVVHGDELRQFDKAGLKWEYRGGTYKWFDFWLDCQQASIIEFNSPDPIVPIFRTSINV